MPISPDSSAPPKIAIVHEWLSTYAGSERVFEQLIATYPDADVLSIVDFVEDKDRHFLQGKTPATTFIQRLPLAQRKFRAYLPVMPLAVEQLNLAGYDIVISSSHAFAKGVITGLDQLHISYVHSPIRYAWDLQRQYLKEAGLEKGPKSWLVRGLLHYIRQWDLRTANGVDVFIANSSFIGRRIRKVYRRTSQVIFPPVDVANFPLREAKDDFYLTASRMVPYKQMPLIIESFARMPDKQLVVIGDGSEFERAKAAAAGYPNIKLLGYAANEVLVDHMQRAKAFVFAALEDFGITPVEAQACGTPVIAYGRGGSLETVVGTGPIAERTGAFFLEQTPESIIAAVNEFEARATDRAAAVAAGAPSQAQVCRAHAEKFAITVFRDRIRQAVSTAWDEFRNG